MTKTGQFLIGAALIATGVVLTLSNMNVLSFGGELTLGVALLVFGGYAYFRFSQERTAWWLLVAGAAGVFFGLAILLDEFSVGVYNLEGVALFAVIGGSFFLVHAYNPDIWWPVIPAGFTLGLAAHILLDDIVRTGLNTGGLMLSLGGGLAFTYLYMIRNETSRLGWAVFPAAGLLLSALVVLAQGTGVSVDGFLLPAGLIVVGILVIVANLRRSRQRIREQSTVD